MITQFIISMIATISFAILYDAPKKHLVYCGLTGGVGWVIYYMMAKLHYNMIFYVFASAFALTLISRILAIVREAPVTMFLIPGIFPIVPGAGIYYTSYYFFINDLHRSIFQGEGTVKIAFSIAFGIIMAMAIPQFLFAYLKLLKR